MEDYYGILATYNPHTKLWYAFDNGDVANYFTNPSKIIYGEGKTVSGVSLLWRVSLTWGLVPVGFRPRFSF